jgi:hypothetical protein
MSKDTDSPPEHTITTLGEILERFIRHEKDKIKEYEAEGFAIKHGPTIGDIYEGLTKAVLNHALPSSLNLRVTQGFISGKDNRTSGQIDCMLVKGIGRHIPNTDHEIVPIENVLVVLEVKKTLYGSELPDIMEHFHQLMDLDPDLGDGINAEGIFRAFAQTCGVSLQCHEDSRKLPLHQHLVYSALLSEHVRPVKIAISYDGFKKESGFRKAFIEMMESYIGKRWVTPMSWPDLIISGEFSMVKMNGRPFTAPSRGKAWEIYGTTRVPAVRMLLELIYTKIASEADVVDFWGEDLESENINRFMEAEAVEEDGVRGWRFQYVEFSEKELQDADPMSQWQPLFADEDEAVTLMLLCNSPDGLDISEIVKGLGDRANALIDRLKKSGLVAQRGNLIELTTKHAEGVFLPDGRHCFGENNTGRLTRWVMNQIHEKAAKDNVPEGPTS